MSSTIPAFRPALRHRARFGRFVLPALGVALTASLALNACSTDFKPDEARDIQTIRFNVGASQLPPRDGFSPDPFTVNRQTEIRWVNGDTTAHQIASVGGFFASPGPIEPGDRFSFLFTEAGSYRYYCSLPNHREVGVINVLR